MPRRRSVDEPHARAMTAQTLGLRINDVAESIRSATKVEREVLLREAAFRLLAAHYLLDRDPTRVDNPLSRLSEEELQRILRGGPMGDFTDIEATMQGLEQELGENGGDA